MKEECLICKAPLEYLQEDILMECSICRKKESSKTRCVNGHYVCNECHSKGVDSIVGLCLDETSSDPIEIIGKMMDMPFCHMHGPEHHIMVGSCRWRDRSWKVSQRDDKQRKQGPWWSLRILGSVRCCHKHRYVHLHHHRFYTSYE